jgi:hypothetical protein
MLTLSRIASLSVNAVLIRMIVRFPHQGGERMIERYEEEKDVLSGNNSAAAPIAVRDMGGDRECERGLSPGACEPTDVLQLETTL